MKEPTCKTPDGLEVFSLPKVGLVVKAHEHNRKISKLEKKIISLKKELDDAQSQVIHLQFEKNFDEYIIKPSIKKLPTESFDQ